jgi:hypothetical protein
MQFEILSLSNCSPLTSHFVGNMFHFLWSVTHCLGFTLDLTHIVLPQPWSWVQDKGFNTSKLQTFMLRWNGNKIFECEINNDNIYWSVNFIFGLTNVTMLIRIHVMKRTHKNVPNAIWKSFFSTYILVCYLSLSHFKRCTPIELV